MPRRSKRNYNEGPPANWADNHISSYASSHPWEDWAESWAHYLHVVDSLDTALRFGLRGEDVEAAVEPFSVNDLYDPSASDAERVILLTNSWVQLTTVLNELARSMGQHDFYPFVMSRAVLRKIHFIQIIVKETRQAASISLIENGPSCRKDNRHVVFCTNVAAQTAPPFAGGWPQP